MGLTRIYSGLAGLGQLIIRNLGDSGGPPAGRVSEELDRIIAWARLSPRIISASFTQIGNVGTGLDNLHSFSLAANSLATNGDFVKGTYSGLFTTNDDDKRLVFSIDGQVILDTALLDIDLGVSTLVGWTGWVVYGRTSATSVAATAHISLEQVFVDGAGAITALPSNGGFFNKYNNLTVSNLTSNAVTLLVQGESATATNNNVDQRMSIYELYQQ